MSEPGMHAVPLDLGGWGWGSCSMAFAWQSQAEGRDGGRVRDAGLHSISGLPQEASAVMVLWALHCLATHSHPRREPGIAIRTHWLHVMQRRQCRIALA